MAPSPTGENGTRGTDIQTQWARVRGKLRTEYGEAAFKSWLKTMTLAEVSGGVARIGVPSRLGRDWILLHYRDRLRSLWGEENKSVLDVELFVLSNKAAGDDAV